MQEEYLHFVLMFGVVVARRRLRRRHRFWVQEILQKRKQYGTYYHLVRELEFNAEQFPRYFRLTREQFQTVLYHVEESLVKVNLTREAICPRQRLAICLRYVLNHSLIFPLLQTHTL